MGYRTAGSRIIRYRESFNRVDEPPFLGSNWEMEITPASNLAGVNFDANVNVGAGMATFGGTGGVPSCVFTPGYVNRQLIKNLSQTRVQYAQFKIRAIVGAVCSIGPSILKANPNSNGCYVLVVQAAGQALQLFRGADLGGSAIIINAAVGVWVVDDVVRIESTVTSSQTTIRCYKNGVLQSTDIDNTAGRISAGMYGIAYYSSTGASRLSFSDFDGGLT